MWKVPGWTCLKVSLTSSLRCICINKNSDRRLFPLKVKALISIKSTKYDKATEHNFWIQLPKEGWALLTVAVAKNTNIAQQCATALIWDLPNENSRRRAWALGNTAVENILSCNRAGVWYVWHSYLWGGQELVFLSSDQKGARTVTELIQW